MSGGRVLFVLVQACLLLAASLCARADDVMSPACFEDEVLMHVRAQFLKYGPRSQQREIFGFIYRMDDRVASAVTVGKDCRGQPECVVNTAFALARIPKGAKVLGEWHTHPGAGRRELSLEDVLGANANRHIRCYAAFYSSPDGTIYRWSIAETDVRTAMASRMQIGNYRASQAFAVAMAALDAN